MTSPEDDGEKGQGWSFFPGRGKSREAPDHGPTHAPVLPSGSVPALPADTVAPVLAAGIEKLVERLDQVLATLDTIVSLLEVRLPLATAHAQPAANIGVAPTAGAASEGPSNAPATPAAPRPWPLPNAGGGVVMSASVMAAVSPPAAGASPPAAVDTDSVAARGHDLLVAYRRFLTGMIDERAIREWLRENKAVTLRPVDQGLAVDDSGFVAAVPINLTHSLLLPNGQAVVDFGKIDSFTFKHHFGEAFAGRVDGSGQLDLRKPGLAMPMGSHWKVIETGEIGGVSSN